MVKIWTVWNAIIVYCNMDVKNSKYVLIIRLGGRSFENRNKDLYKEIKKNVILDNVNITLTGGKIYGIQGKNGCGKTMLMLQYSRTCDTDTRKYNHKWKSAS